MLNGDVQKIRGGCGMSGAGEQDHNPGSAARFTIDVDQSAVCGDDAADSGQSQARAFPGVLGGEKRIEEMLAGFRIHAAAVVADGEKNTGKGSNSLWWHRTGNTLELTVAGLYDNAATLGQGVAGVENKVEQDLLGLCLIDFDQTEIGIETEVEDNVFADQAGEEIPHRLGNLVQAQCPGLRRLGTGENQQLPHQAGGLHDGGANFIGVAAPAIA